MSETAAPDLGQQARDLLDSIRYVVLATVDADGRPRTSPVYFTPSGYQDLYWVSYDDTHHSQNLGRDPRASGVVLDSTLPPGEGSAVYVTGTAREVGPDDLPAALPRAFDPEGRGGRRFSVDELTDEDGLRLWVLHVEAWEVHVGAGHPVLGTGHDRRVAVDPRRVGGVTGAGGSGTPLP
jgi:nitroimidazol reductase NimA-like FMN-containing flavoprotein (pyridoxamine 5'-phosphate oxidase superfamily)